MTLPLPIPLPTGTATGAGFVPDLLPPPGPPPLDTLRALAPRLSHHADLLEQAGRAIQERWGRADWRSPAGRRAEAQVDHAVTVMIADAARMRSAAHAITEHVAAVEQSALAGLARVGQAGVHRAG